MHAERLCLIHAADLHLGHNFARFPARVRQTLINDEPRLLARLVDVCIDEKADALLLPGDVFEFDQPEDATVRLLVDTLTALNEAGVYVFIAPGNHDPHWPDAIWSTVAWPDKTIVFGPGRQTFHWRAKQAIVYGAAFQEKLAKVELLNAFVPTLTEQHINVLVLHGEVVADGQVTSYNPIRARLLETPQLDYAALGHIHKGWHETDDWAYPNAAYAGIWRGRGFDETGVKGVLKISIEKMRTTVNIPFASARPLRSDPPELEFLPLGGRVFKNVVLSRTGPVITTETIKNTLFDIADTEGFVASDALWRVQLVGDYGEYRPSLASLLATLEKMFFHIELMDWTQPPSRQTELQEHSLQGAFLRQASRGAPSDELQRLAEMVGLEAFAGPVDLTRFFTESDR